MTGNPASAEFSGTFVRFPAIDFRQPGGGRIPRALDEPSDLRRAIRLSPSRTTRLWRAPRGRAPPRNGGGLESPLGVEYPTLRPDQWDRVREILRERGRERISDR
ncbi:MAG: hypothetical protein EA351_01630 [Gemmatimonadales bacterium]|nr:MAG: hypothetical protein EA351_01630 [Gemmatimonadales bacterium]